MGGPRFLAIGECMVELAPAGDGLYARGFAGDTFNTAWYARRLLPPAVPVAYLSAVGDDAISSEMVAFIAAAGIEPEVATIPGATVGLYMISLARGERSFTYWRSASAARRLAEELCALAAAGPGALVYTSGITAAILPPEGRARLAAGLAAARAAGAEVAFDPNLRPRLWAGTAEMTRTIMEFAAVADIVFPSHDDEATHFGDADPAATAARYLGAGAGLVVVKDGPGAVVVAGRGGVRARVVPEAVASPVDTTAAGDSFNAGFLAARMTGAAPPDAARAGCRLATRVIARRGALVEI